MIEDKQFFARVKPELKFAESQPLNEAFVIAIRHGKALNKPLQNSMHVKSKKLSNLR